MKEILLVSATRKTSAEFEKTAPLFASLQKLRAAAAKVSGRIAYQNRQGLGTIYNQFLSADHADKILVFAHDDVRIEDLFFAEKLNEAIQTFDVVGIAGNRRPDADCLSWFDRARPLSGFVAHSLDKHPADSNGQTIPADARGETISADSHRETIFVSSYGPAPAACGLLDGLFLAVNAERVLARGARFDERFAFHFYDLDFCLNCAEKGLRLGTWPLWVVHQSGGSFDSPEWREAAQMYREKWHARGRLHG